MPESVSVTLHARTSYDSGEFLRELRGILSANLTKCGIAHECIEPTREDSPFIQLWYGPAKVELLAHRDMNSADHWAVECRATLPWIQRIFLNRTDLDTLERLALRPFCMVIDDALRRDQCRLHLNHSGRNRAGSEDTGLAG